MNHGRSRKLWLAFLSLLGIAVLFGLTGFLLKAAVSPYQNPPGKQAYFEIQKGTLPIEISRQLEARGLIRDANFFYWVGRIRGSWGRIKAAEYELSSSMNAIQILDVLISGIGVQRQLLIREGENVYEIAHAVELKGWGTQQQFLELARDRTFISTLGFSPPLPDTLEGYLFPDTYQFSRQASQKEIIRTAVKKFQNVWGAPQEQKARELGMTRNAVITLASIVEKETGASEERPMIAGVFFNRLKKKMKLQSDPTTIYGIWERYKGNIHRSDLLEPTPYNTYTVPALPIGPISNPGREAIQATLYPAKHPYLYFVSKNNGTHAFTATYADHLNAVKDFQLKAAAREGKSWRDLKKNPTVSGDAGKVLSP